MKTNKQRYVEELDKLQRELKCAYERIDRLLPVGGSLEDRRIATLQGARIHQLEKENEQLRNEVEALKERVYVASLFKGRNV